MRSEADLAAVRALLEQGLNDCEIARRTGIPRPTVRGWRTGSQRTVARRTVVDPDELPHASYSYLLGLYLGDGHIVAARRGVYKFSVYLDQRYVNIIMWCLDATKDVMPASKPNVVFRPGCVGVYSYSKLWPEVFPQHGPGRKHERSMVLAGWQEQIVDREPQQFLRGLIHSDGCRFTNRVRSHGKTYEYPRYNFSNNSADIRALFTRSCDQLGIEWRQMNATNISVARRASVAALDEFIGPKR
jgi:hypothetical protein